jgi:hypothetical protein
MENRNGLAVGGMVTQANGTAERRASEALLKKKAKGLKRITVGEDKAYDTSDHVAALRRMSVTPHIAQNDSLTRPASGVGPLSMRGQPAISGIRFLRPVER